MLCQTRLPQPNEACPLRSLFILFTLAASLAALTEMSRLAANLSHVASGGPGALLHAADFTSAARDQDLFAGRLSAQLVEGALRLSAGDPGSLVYAATGPHFQDFDLEVEARPLAGPLDNAYGLLFRLREAQSAPLLEALGLPGSDFAGARSYYLFLISSDGYYQLRRSQAGEQQILSAWIPSPLIRQGLEISNRLRVVAQESTLHFYINGEPVALCIPDDAQTRSTWANDECVGGQMRLTLQDESPEAGRIALVAQSFQQAGVVLAFDNLLVRMPQPMGASA